MFCSRRRKLQFSRLVHHAVMYSRATRKGWTFGAQLNPSYGRANMYIQHAGKVVSYASPLYHRLVKEYIKLQHWAAERRREAERRNRIP